MAGTIDPVYFSRIAFVFIVFTVISSGYIAEILSCQMRFVFENSLYFRHFVGILMIFSFIMLEGGWSFDQKLDDSAPTNWASGNVIDSGIMAVGIYVIFLLSSKSRFFPNLLFFGLVLVLYLMNTQREYWLARSKITEEQNERALFLEYGILALSGGTLVFGFVDYIRYQMAERGDRFSWLQFLLGGHSCARLGNEPRVQSPVRALGNRSKAMLA